VYETLPGWREDIRESPDRESLPEAARAYLARIEAVVGIPVEVVSLGPERTQTLVGGRRAAALAHA
jgi:adenylosuccinate synthase